MVDFILLCFFVGAFIGGFWCGKTFSTLGQMVDAGVAKVNGWLGRAKTGGGE